MHLTLQDALSELPEIHRRVLALHYLGGMSCKEIAQFLGTSPHAIAMRLNRARAKLRKEMLTMMGTTFEQQKLNPGFTLNIVEVIQRTRIQSNPQIPAVSHRDGLSWPTDVVNVVSDCTLSIKFRRLES